MHGRAKVKPDGICIPPPDPVYLKSITKKGNLGHDLVPKAPGKGKGAAPATAKSKPAPKGRGRASSSWADTPVDAPVTPRDTAEPQGGDDNDWPTASPAVEFLANCTPTACQNWIQDQERVKGMGGLPLKPGQRIYIGDMLFQHTIFDWTRHDSVLLNQPHQRGVHLASHEEIMKISLIGPAAAPDEEPYENADVPFDLRPAVWISEQKTENPKDGNPSTTLTRTESSSSLSDKKGAQI